MTSRRRPVKSARKSLGYGSSGYESFDHVESTAVRPKTVLIIAHSVARALGADTFDMSGTQPRSRSAPAVVALCTAALLLWPPPVRALDPSLDISQYAHLAWTFRNGFLLSQSQLTFQVDDLFLGLCDLLGLFRDLSIAFGQFTAKPFHLVLQTLLSVFALPSLGPRHAPHGTPIGSICTGP